jgi:hypothetical protein
MSTSGTFWITRFKQKRYSAPVQCTRERQSVPRLKSKIEHGRIDGDFYEQTQGLRHLVGGPDNSCSSAFEDAFDVQTDERAVLYDEGYADLPEPGASLSPLSPATAAMRTTGMRAQRRIQKTHAFSSLYNANLGCRFRAPTTKPFELCKGGSERRSTAGRTLQVRPPIPMFASRDARSLWS